MIMIYKKYMDLYRNEMNTLDRYTRLPRPEIAMGISEWLSEHDIMAFKTRMDLERFIANRWYMTDKQAQRLINVLMSKITGRIEPLLVG
jgi:hypothetical protein